MLKNLFRLLIPLAFVLAACAPAIPVTGSGTMEKTDDAMVEKSDTATMEKTNDAMMEKPADSTMEKTDDAMMEKTDDGMMGKPDEAGPAWFGTTLTDVRSGKTFSINDYAGKVVMIETLAMWCSNCKQQQGQVKAFHEALGGQMDLVTIGLDVDPNEKGEDLKAYAEKNGFDWVYAVAPVETAHEIASLYGDQFLNPPSTPILVIDRQGNVHLTPFGIKSAQDLLSFVEPFLKEEM